MQNVQKLSELREIVSKWRQKGERIGLVATMGALHEGHLSLVELARAKANRTVVSIFVNPTQFGEGEDLLAYPRELAADMERLEQRGGVDLVYAPGESEIYPPGFATKIHVDGVSEGLCGAARPGHFDGVATVVAKLMGQTGCDVAVFGEKDFQQLAVIRAMVRDLDLAVEVVGAPIIREGDGLALSSRNAYLSAGERRKAPLLYESLCAARDEIKAGRNVAAALGEALVTLAAHGFVADYLELREAANLAPLAHWDGGEARLLVAAKLGRTRLIDNVAVMG